MKKGDKFFGYTNLTSDLIKLEVLGGGSGAEGYWVVRVERVEAEVKYITQMPASQIQRIVNNLMPASLDNV